MIIRKSAYGENSPFPCEYIPETEEERDDLCIRDLCAHLGSTRSTLWVEREILDKAVQRGCLKHCHLLRVNARDIVSDARENTEWVLELFRLSADGKQIVLVFDIPDGFDDEYRMRFLIALCKDRVFLTEQMPDHVSIIVTAGAYDETRDNDWKPARELMGLCIPMVTKRYPVKPA